MTHLREFLQMVKPEEKVRYDFRSKEVKVRIRQVNQETDTFETQTTDFCTGLLYSNREEPDHDTLESSI
jgi:hypothetical protein